MKIRSYKEYKCNGFCLKYYTRIINDYGVQRTIVIAYCDGRRMKDFAGEEKYALRSFICRLVDEQRAADTEAYIKEQAARMGVSEYIVRAHIEEVQRKNMKATVQAEKTEITAEDIALYDYAMGGAPVEGYTITSAETILKSMKKAGITPAAVERARKKINKEKKAAAPAPVVEAPAPAEARKFRLYYINHSDKAVSRVVELIKADVEGSPLPVWIECREDDYGRKYGHTCYQLTDSICFRANAGYISEEYISPLTGGEISDWHKEHIDMFNNGMANIKAEIIATPAAQLNGTMWPNLAVVNAYTAAGMATEAAYLIAARERITKEREERRKTQEEESRRHEEERRRQEAEEKARRIAEATKKFVEKGEITGEDVVMLCDEEGIRINPRTRHNLLEVVTYFENNGNRAHYKTCGKRKPSLDGCFTVADSLYQLLKIKADEAENAAPAAPDFAEVLAADAVAMPLALPAITESAIIEQAARIKAAHETLKAEAEREQAAAAFADAITAYCEALETPAAPAWTPEVITLTPCPAWDDTPAADEQPAPAPRARRRLNIAPRLSRWLHPVRWVAVVFVVRLLSGLLLGMNTSTAADDIAAAYDLAPVTVTAEAPDTFIEDEAPCLIEDKAPRLIEDKAPAPSPVKKLAAPSPVKNMADAAECSSQKTDTADTPAGEKTASPMNTASDPHGLTICEGTPWAYTMMNWA